MATSLRRRRGQLGEDPVAEGAEDLGDLDRVAAGIALHLLVLDPLEHAGIEALVEHDLLDVEDHLVDRVIRSRRMRDRLSCHDSVISLRSKAGENWKALSLEDLVDQQLECLALPGAGDRA